MHRWKRMLAVSTVVLMAGAGTGCMRNSWKTDLKPVRASYEERASWYLAGLVPTKEYNMDEFCPDGKIAKVQTKRTFGNYLAQMFTLNIWAPQILTVTCGQGAKKSKATDDSSAEHVSPMADMAAADVEGGAK